ncbi:hypothetical protein CHLRE_02g105400v5 [Chlamydomonas reinhardtii]|uniref:protein-tyrosine-phosphatase n=1 Tax=Chlamydomonas reinhardtii TaxID=3055 RepID=A0A2K3E2J4_CHLRE|nr:uncharacterized protein CHLRE_02g105400v5 [Chlamydomonas reinhardtii]PNW87019.1 hypothetical protein CHLRE_02g105400v5 [Chlamydomonas reinhardtii]
MPPNVDEFATEAIPIINGLYYFIVIRRPDSPRFSATAQQNICYSIDDSLLYEPFFADFGPLNLGRTFRFCQQTKQLLQEAERHGKRLYLYTGPHAHQKANAAVLVGIYQVIYMNMTADMAYKPLAALKPYVPFRDASCGVSTFHLTVYDVMRGIQRARDVGFIDWNSGSSTWSLEEYEYYEQVENGDLNWIVPGKFVAFSGPAARCNEIAGYRLHTPEDYWEYFRRRGVTTIVRLNKKVYDRKRFLDGGFKHHEMYFPDGSCPNDAIIQRFLDTVEAEPGSIAVHCKAGLGRTGVLICLYIMKHYRFTAEEVIGYIRVCRPGSVIGPQQNFIREMESRMWHEGEMYRAARGLPKVAPAGQLLIAGRAAGGHNGHGYDAAEPAAAAAAPSSAVGGSRGGSASAGGAGSGGYGGSYGQLRAGSGSAAGSRGGSATGGSGAGTGMGSRDVHGSGGGGSILSGAGAAAAASASDMSLLQYSKQYGGSDGYGHGGGSGGYVSSSQQAAPVASLGSFRSRYGSGLAPAGYSNSAGGGAGRSMTPLRYGAGSSAAGGYGGYGSSAAGGGYGSHQGALSPSGILGPRGGMGAVSRSMPAAPGSSGGGGSGHMGRSPSTGRLSAAAGLAAPPSSSSVGSVAGLRSTLHTETLAAADRPKVIPERNTQSADIGSGFGLGGAGSGAASPWRLHVPASPTGSSGPATPTTPAGGHMNSVIGGVGVGASGLGRASSIGARSNGSSPSTPTTPGSTSGGVARILAPNGQPRKVPVALLNQYSAAVVAGSGGGGGSGSKPPSAGSMGAGVRSSGYGSYGMRQ